MPVNFFGLSEHRSQDQNGDASAEELLVGSHHTCLCPGRVLP